MIGTDLTFLYIALLLMAVANITIIGVLQKSTVKIDDSVVIFINIVMIFIICILGYMYFKHRKEDNVGDALKMADDISSSFVKQKSSSR